MPGRLAARADSVRSASAATSLAFRVGSSVERRRVTSGQSRPLARLTTGITKRRLRRRIVSP